MKSANWVLIPIFAGSACTSPRTPVPRGATEHLQDPPPPPHWSQPGSIVSSSAAAQETKRRLNAIIIPTLTFDEATFDEALEFLRYKTRELVGDEWAYSLYHHSPSLRPPIEREPADETVVSLRRENISVWDALTITANQAGYDVQILNTGRLTIRQQSG